MLKFFVVVFFIAVFGSIIFILIKALGPNKNRTGGNGGDSSRDRNKETDALCRTLTPEELYENACKLVKENGTKSDYYRWENFMSTAAKKGYIPAVREWGIYNANKNNDFALDLLTKAADADDGKAVEELFRLYYYGSYGGVPKIEKDRDKAVSIIKPYAEKGNAVAQRLLGNYYYYEKDSNKKALEWYLKAADGGDAEAMVQAADIYSYKEDFEAQEKLLLKAAEQDYEDAEFNLGVFYQTFERDDETYDFEKAMYWYKRAFGHGGDLAACYVGEMYLNGEGVPKDEYQAFEWFKKSFEAGSIVGTYHYGKCYMEGIGVEQDKKEGIRLYTKAAEYVSDAQYALGLCYLEGNGVKKDLKTAVDYLKKAAHDRMPNEEAQDKLEELYSSGEIDKDEL
ncbi:MAG: hypothetical protein K2J61_04655 [Clostridia bacterium]|nr:hypothetical protein [Clostridia bacterium]